MRLHLKQGLKKGRVGFAVFLLVVSLGLALGLSEKERGSYIRILRKLVKIIDDKKA